MEFSARPIPEIPTSPRIALTRASPLKAEGRRQKAEGIEFLRT